MQWAYSGVSIMATPATSNMTNTKQNKETKQETVFLSSPSLARCCHSVRGALGSFKRNFTGTEWFYCSPPINREQLQNKKTKSIQSSCIFTAAQWFPKLWIKFSVWMRCLSVEVNTLWLWLFVMSTWNKMILSCCAVRTHFISSELKVETFLLNQNWKLNIN